MNTHFDIVTVTLNPSIDRTVTIPNFTAGVVNRVETVRSNPGGKGVNVASSQADSGHRVAVTGFLGRENAASFEALFAQKKIGDHFIRIAGQTRVGIKVADPVLNQTTDINFPGPASSPFDLEALAAQIATLDADTFVLAGSLPPGVAPTIYRDLVSALRSRGKRVVLDASGEPLRLALEAKPHLFKPNTHEVGELLGETISSERAVIAAARKLIASGVEQVVVSMGRDGACFATAHEALFARAGCRSAQHRRGGRRHGRRNRPRPGGRAHARRDRSQGHSIFGPRADAWQRHPRFLPIHRRHHRASDRRRIMKMRGTRTPGSTLVPSVGAGVPPAGTSLPRHPRQELRTRRPAGEVRFDGTPKPGGQRPTLPRACRLATPTPDSGDDTTPFHRPANHPTTHPQKLHPMKTSLLAPSPRASALPVRLSPKTARRASPTPTAPSSKRRTKPDSRPMASIPTTT